MSIDTRTQIIVSAHRLFNQQGYSQVTMRDIANELGISVGNLTYHFKQKKDLIEAIFAFSDSVDRNEKPMLTLQDLNDWFNHLIFFQINEHATFEDHDFLTKLSPKTKAIQERRLKGMKEVFINSLFQLQEAGFIKKEAYEGQYAMVSDMVLILNTYSYAHYIRFGITDKDVIGNRVLKSLHSTLDPLLTQRGLDARSEIKEKNYTGKTLFEYVWSQY